MPVTLITVGLAAVLVLVPQEPAEGRTAAAPQLGTPYRMGRIATKFPGTTIFVTLARTFGVTQLGASIPKCLGNNGLKIALYIEELLISVFDPSLGEILSC